VDPVDNASALPTGSTARNSRHRRLLPHQFEARKPAFPRHTRSRIVSETPTDSSEEAEKSITWKMCTAFGTQWLGSDLFMQRVLGISCSTNFKNRALQASATKQTSAQQRNLRRRSLRAASFLTVSPRDEHPILRRKRADTHDGMMATPRQRVNRAQLRDSRGQIQPGAIADAPGNRRRFYRQPERAT
jgi:hypothetical protein